MPESTSNTDRYGTVQFVSLEHGCDLPRLLELEYGESASYRWRCPECGQRWFVGQVWRNRDERRIGRAKRKWRRRRAAELAHSEEGQA